MASIDLTVSAREALWLSESKGHELCSNTATLKLNKSEVATWLSLVEGTDWSERKCFTQVTKQLIPSQY